MGHEEATVEVRLLAPADAEALRALRLRGLREEPTAFGRAAEEEEGRDVAWFAERLREQDGSGAGAVFGAFARGALVGMLGSYQEQALRVRHRANLWGMYVAPEARGRGVGRALLDAALAHLRQVPGVEQVHLSHTGGHAEAAALYRSVGFRSVGTVPRAMKVGEAFHDEELLVRFLP